MDAAGLLERGIPRDRVRHLEGTLRAFAGFTKASPFAYTLALVLLCWLGLALSRRERGIALRTAWLPVAAVVGLVWAHNRLTPLALGVAIVVVAARETVARRSRAVWPAAVGIAAAAVVVGVLFHHWSTGPSATFRVTLWGEYLREISPVGAGPASAGSAYRRAEFRPWLPPVTFGPEWVVRVTEADRLSGEAAAAGTLLVAAGDSPSRPRLTLRGSAASSFRSGRLDVRHRGTVLFRAPISTRGYSPMLVRLPPGGGSSSARLVLAITPARSPVNSSSPATVIRVRGLHVLGAPLARTPTTRVQLRMWERSPEMQTFPTIFHTGLVDNQYVSWLFQYGLFGVVLGALWIWLLLVPIVRGSELRSLALASGLCASFLAAAAVGVNVWEEAPADLLTAVVLGFAFAGGSRSPSRGGID